MKKYLALLMVILTFGFLNAKDSKEAKLPKAISKLLDKAVKGETTRDDLQFEFLKDLYYPAQQGNIYFVNFAKANLPDLEEGKPAHLFLRLYDKKGKKIRDYYAPINKKSNIYSFAITFKPDFYKTAVLMATNDFKQISVKTREIKGENLINFRKLSTTPIIFLKGMKKLPEVVKEFHCYNGEFPLGLYMVYPFLENSFKGGQTPAVFFFVTGAQAKKPANTYSIVVSYEIKKDGKSISKFPKQELTYSVVYQPIPLKSKGKPLEAGDYELHITIFDMNAREKIEKVVPFKITL